MSAAGGLNGYMLNAAQKRKLQRRRRDESLAGLHELIADEYVGSAAQTALRCVKEKNADPRLMLLLLEAALEGFFGPTPAEVAQRQAAAREGAEARWKAGRPGTTQTAPVETSPSPLMKGTDRSDE